MNMMREDTSELSIARRAVIEGQATVVGLDYVLREAGISLAESPKARQLANSLLLSSYSPAVTIHNAPRLLREVMIFPYREACSSSLSYSPKAAANKPSKRPSNAHRSTPIRFCSRTLI